MREDVKVGHHGLGLEPEQRRSCRPRPPDLDGRLGHQKPRAVPPRKVPAPGSASKTKQEDLKLLFYKVYLK